MVAKTGNWMVAKTAWKEYDKEEVTTWYKERIGYKKKIIQYLDFIGMERGTDSDK